MTRGRFVNRPYEFNFSYGDVLFHFRSPLGYCLYICPRGQNVDKNENRTKKDSRTEIRESKT